MKNSQTSSSDVRAHKAGAQNPKICGIVRPIADMGTYTAKHWRDVHNVIAEAVESIGFTLRLVSESDTAGVILTEIVTNLYQDEIVIVDVSGRNPNVMFELGMRLAFEKPAIIVMDDETPFSFDISPVKHIRYPRTLRYSDIVKFKSEISSAVEASISLSAEKRNYLQQFGPIKVTELGSNAVDLSSIVQEVQDVRRLMVGLVNRINPTKSALSAYIDDNINFSEHGTTSTINISLPSHLHEDFIGEIAHVDAVRSIDAGENILQIFLQGRAQSIVEARNELRMIARELEMRETD